MILGSSGCTGDVADETIETLQRSLHQLAAMQQMVGRLQPKVAT